MFLKGKTALITGSTSGIGGGYAKALAAEGAAVMINGFGDAGEIETLRQELESLSGVKAAHSNADMTKPEAIRQMCEDCAEQLGTVDILINNAGQGVDHDFRQELPDADAADACIYANLDAPIRLITALVPMLGRRGEAAIVNVTSGLAIAPRAGGPVYCATKAGLRSYTMALREQLKDTNIHVIEALPPVVETQMTADRQMKKMPPQECAAQILDALESNADEANVGQVRLLRWVYSLSPALARRVMLRF